MSSLYSPPIIKDKILTNISAAIREIHRLAVDDDEQHTTRRITNENWEVHCLLEHLDFALLYGLKFVPDGYYKCVREFTPKNLTAQIEASYNIETDIGRGRAWIFSALNDNLAESYIRCFQDHRKLVKQFYTTDSLVNDAERLIALSTLCSGLENIKFELATDCVYFDRSCWPAYLQAELKAAETNSSNDTRSNVPSFATYFARYNTQHAPTFRVTSQTATIAIARNPKKKRSGRINSSMNNMTPTDNQIITSSRSSSISVDNPSIERSSFNEENEIPICIPITTNSPVPTTALSSSLSELDPMFNNRPRSPSPVVQQQIIPIQIDELPVTNSIETAASPPLTNTIPDSSAVNEVPSPVSTEELSPVNEQRNSVLTEDSITTSDRIESSLSISISNGFSDLSIEKKIDDILRMAEDDALEIPADANLQLQCTLEVYEMPNEEAMIKLYPTTISHNNGNVEVVFLLVTTLNVYLLRQINEMNGSYRIDKIESIRLTQIDYVEIGPNEQFLRIITVKHTKLRSLTTGCVALTRAICASITKATKIARLPAPQVLPATMQELSIKKELANDMKKSSAHEVKLLDYHYTFWEEPQMSGRKLRKEGYLTVLLIEPPTTMRRLSAATMKVQRHGFETWRKAYVTLRVDRLNIFLHKSDLNPTLTYTLVDENCQGCRRNRNGDRPNAIEIMFANDVTLMMAAKTKTEQDEWLTAIMKGLSQGRMSNRDDGDSANTVPCSVMITDEKLYVCHDEQDNALIRQLDSIKLEYVVRLLIDPHHLYYCVISIEHGMQGSKSWIFYFLFTKEMVQFIRSLQQLLSDTYQIPFDIHPLEDMSFQSECEQTSKHLLRTYRPTTLTP